MAARSEFKLDLELKDLKPEQVIAGFKAARAVPIVSLLEGFLCHDQKKTLLFFARMPFSNEDKAALSKWAREYFHDLIAPGAKATESSLAKRSVRELVVLGLIYDSGLGVKQDLNKAFQCYQSAAQQHDAMGIYYVGCCFRYGLGVAQNTEQAKQYYEKALEMGCVWANTSYALLIEDSDPALALYHYKFAAEQGDPGALTHLGIGYHQGFHSISKNLNTATQLYAASALMGAAYAIYNYSVTMPQNEQYKFMRLGVAGRGKDWLRNMFAKPDSKPTPTLTYHAALGLNGYTISRDLVKLKTAFTRLYTDQSDEIDRLSCELDDSNEVVLSLFNEEDKQQLVDKHKLAQVWLQLLTSPTQRFPLPLLKIIANYTTFLMPFFLEKEEAAKTRTESLLPEKLLLTDNQSTLFKEKAARAARYEISYQEVMHSKIGWFRRILG